MNKLFFLAAAVLALAVFGCGTNSGSGIVGPGSSGALNASAPPSGSGGTPIPDGIDIPAGALAFYGMVSNLSAGSFTLTAPDGRAVNVTTDENTRVLALGVFYAVDASALADGQEISLWGRTEGRPIGPPGEGTTINAVLIVINARPVNGLIVVD